MKGDKIDCPACGYKFPAPNDGIRFRCPKCNVFIRLEHGFCSPLKQGPQADKLDQLVRMQSDKERRRS